MVNGRYSPPASPSEKAHYLPLVQESSPLDSPTTPTFRSATLASDGDSGSDGGGHVSRPYLAQRRRSTAGWVRMRSLLMGRIAKVVLVVGVLVGLHQLAFPTLGAHETALRPAYTGSEPSRGLMDDTLARVGLKWSEDEPFVTALEERLVNPPLPPYQYLVGTMEHNESKNILEWLFYHISQGMDHFVIYDHFSTDETRELLAPLVDAGWVTLIDYAHEDQWAQPLAFERFTAEWKGISKWLLFFDIDEFIARNTSLLGPSALAEPFGAWFDREYSQYGGVALPRLPFSSNGHYTRPEEGVLSAFTETRDIDRNFFAPKVMSQARFKAGGGNIHSQNFSNGLKLVDPNGKAGDQMWEDKGGYPVYLHHYWAGEFEGCVARIKQKAFPGSWRELMGDKFCRLEMQHTDEHATLPHHQDETLAKYGAGVRAVVDRYRQRHPLFSAKDYTLSVLSSSRYSSSRSPFSPSSIVEPGTTLVVDSPNPIGFVEVVLSSKNSKATLPVNRRSDGGVSFTIPASTSTDSESGYHELHIAQRHAPLSDPEQDPVSECSLIGHIRNRPEAKQLQTLRAGRCKDVDLDSAWSNAIKTWPHSHVRDDILFRRFFKLAPAQLPSPSALSLPQLGEGRWKRFSLFDFPSSGEPSTARLFTSERCPRRFDAGYWNPSCGNETTLAAQGGVFRWLPDASTSYSDVALRPSAIKQCLGAGSPKPRRVVIVGDSVASHTYMAMQCLLDQVGPGIEQADHLRFHSFQYEVFDLVGATGEQGMTPQAWEQLVAWEYDENAQVAKVMPDAVVLNVGLWAVSWAQASEYEAGLRASFRTLKDLAKEHGVKLLWRETTGVFPKTDDPLYQNNARVERFNRIADKLAAEAGVPVLPAYQMSVARSDGARDNAHMCSYVQGDLAEVLLHGLCKNVLSS
ncbi:hypothetical protein JCM10213_000797 [Rhodosporidiobolus nylandii]